ncbi:hypothetical protein ABK040_004195 [Willaertia magna]
MLKEEQNDRTALNPHFNNDNTRSIFSNKCLSLSLFIIISLFLLSLIINIVLIYLKATNNSTTTIKKPKNIIFMIGDGFGPAGQTFTRTTVMNANPSTNKTLPLDHYLIGTARTYSFDSDVTDSAAGATAYSCNLKTYNGAIGVNEKGEVCGTLLEAAIAKGMKTGIVATTAITDATPASFSSHVSHRSKQADIAKQQVTLQAKMFNKPFGIDLIMGGGKSYFLPNTNPNSLRKDNENLIELAKTNYGYQFIENTIQLNNLNNNEEDNHLPLLGLFANLHMKYNIDRNEFNETEPTLLEMTNKAIELLNKKNENGFFLMIEGSRIDHCGHDNDISCMYQEILHYNEVINFVMNFAKEDKNTLVISVADHETGGLTLGKMINLESEYIYNTEYVRKITKSSEFMTSEILKNINNDLNNLSFDIVNNILLKYGVLNLTLEEYNLIKNFDNLMYGINEVINNRVRVGFTTRAHTGIDINVYGYGDASVLFRGNQENIEVGQKVANLMGFDLESITRLVRESLQ